MLDENALEKLDSRFSRVVQVQLKRLFNDALLRYRAELRRVDELGARVAAKVVEARRINPHPDEIADIGYEWNRETARLRTQEAKALNEEFGTQARNAEKNFAAAVYDPRAEELLNLGSDLDQHLAALSELSTAVSDLFDSSSARDHVANELESKWQSKALRIEEARLSDQSSEDTGRQQPPKTEPPAESPQRPRRGFGRPPIDPVHQRKLVEIVDSHGGTRALTHGDTLEQVCKELDEAAVLAPTTWSNDDPPAWSWARQCQPQNDPAKVRKAIRERYRKFKQAQN